MVASRVVAQRYRLEQPLGAGGMGSVWRASDLELGRTVALKRSHTADGQQIRREARIGAGLTHPRVVSVFDVVTDGEDRWIVMEYVPSRRLDELAGDQPPAPAALWRIGAALADALAAMHAAGVVHRDVTPANVLVTEDGAAKLTDLGIARWADATVTGGARAGGTAAYLAPEVADGGEAGPEADVFSLGATLFAAATGGSPWGSGESGPFAQLRRAAAYEREPTAAAGELAPVLDALLARDPRDRPSAAQARALLADPDSTPPTIPAPPPPRARPGRRRWVLAGAATAVVIVAAAALVVALDRPSTPAAATAPTAPAAAARQEPPGTLGDPRTADPCALLVPNALSRFGNAVLEPNYGNFNHCDVIVSAPHGGDTVDVAAELQPPDEYPGVPPTPGRLGRVQEDQPTEDRCQRTIPLPNLYRVVIFAHPVHGQRIPLCAAAEAAALAAYGLLAQGPIPRRGAPFPSTSTGAMDACGLLGPRELTAAIGKAADAEPDYGHWTCYWENGPKQVTVEFGREYPLEDDPPDGTRADVDGHTAFVDTQTNDGKRDECLVTFVHRRYTPTVPSQKGTPAQREETVMVSLEDENSTDGQALCPATTALARSAVARSAR